MSFRLTFVIPVAMSSLVLASAVRPGAQDDPRPVVGRSMVVTE